ncbi:MAG: PilZ domain-containing protein [Bdellovibrionota bacterium]
MIENRKAYRVPFRTKFVYATEEKVITGNTVNLSAGGIFISALELLPRETQCKVLFQLSPDEAPISISAIIKRVSQSTTDPEHIPGLGFQFVGAGHEEVKQRIDIFMEETRKNFEVAATILSSGEPDLSSLSEFLSRMHLPSFQDLGELRMYVERVLRAIELVESNTKDELSR